MRNVRLVVTYDGTRFHGWQVQPEQRTVQGVLGDALAAVLEEPVTLHGAGRTDAGVHARGQVASFATASRLPARALAPLLNRALPEDLRVRSAADVPADFDARCSARARRYAYRLLDADDLLHERFAWRPPRAVAPDRAWGATAVLEGEHDFSSFRNTGGTPTTPRCRVMRVAWSRWEAGFVFEIVADHFLYHMVRIIVGTALAAAATTDPAGAMRAILRARDRTRAGLTVPARGLCLEQVYYAPGVAA